MTELATPEPNDAEDVWIHSRNWRLWINPVIAVQPLLWRRATP